MIKIGSCMRSPLEKESSFLNMAWCAKVWNFLYQERIGVLVSSYNPQSASGAMAPAIPDER